MRHGGPPHPPGGPGAVPGPARAADSIQGAAGASSDALCRNTVTCLPLGLARGGGHGGSRLGVTSAHSQRPAASLTGPRPPAGAGSPAGPRPRAVSGEAGGRACSPPAPGIGFTCLPHAKGEIELIPSLVEEMTRHHPAMASWVKREDVDVSANDCSYWTENRLRDKK